ncbi:MULTISPECIES: DUF11 domain-containing protein [unclassified Streptomyces]|uniref:DUF11 domain-containing protein n=1 Tax=unclassified Streptomyces TaxID=2593676 RepID=UPI000823E79F|nr:MULTISPECIES: DUF11 domain-containing protein [unclassified Streptomyces]SCK61020.1 hypothetical protein YW7DRAFT_06151 [Streptomyces sp. AmelKG-E11A]
MRGLGRSYVEIGVDFFPTQDKGRCDPHRHVRPPRRPSADAFHVRLTDDLPTALGFVPSEDDCESGDTVVRGALATLAPGASVTWVFRVKLDPQYTGDGSDIRNTARVGALTRDPVPGNDSSTTGTPGGSAKRPTADLEVTKETP